MMTPMTGEPRPSDEGVTRLLDPDAINFGDLPAPINALLQQGVIAYRKDRMAADALFRQALAVDPTWLASYFCLYKIHTYQGHLEDAEAAALAGLTEAARQAGWPADWRAWPVLPVIPDGAGRFALYTLKALAFIRLRQDDRAAAREILAALKRFDPAGVVGWPVIEALAEGLS